MQSMSSHLNSAPRHRDSDKRTTASFLALPYDVRYLIYQHLFPPERQVYIQVFNQALAVIIPEERIPFDLLLTCKALHTEVGAFMYSHHYLFNILGTKKECLTAYPAFLTTMQKHAEGKEVHVKAFSNGVHSSTMCISLAVGEAKINLLKNRRRGEPVEIQTLEMEIASKAPQIRSSLPPWVNPFLVIATCVAMLAVLIALVLYGQP